MPQEFGDNRAISPKVHKDQTGMGAGCLTLFFGTFLLAGLAFAYFLLIVPLWKISQAANWVKTPCTITASEVEADHGDDGTTYRVAMKYDYTYNGQPYHGDRYSFAVGSTSGRKFKEQAVARYPVGSTRHCFVNPSHPGESVVNREFTSEMWFGLFPMIFVVVGVVGVGFSLRSWIRRSKAPPVEIPGTLSYASISESPVSRDPFAKTNDLQRLSQDGYVELTSNRTGCGGWVVLLIFAGGWNTAVAFMVAKVVESFQAGRPEWFLTFFSIPFVVIGLVLVLLVCSSFLALFNPRPTVAIRPGEIPL